NGHVVLEEWPPNEVALLPLSAASGEALRVAAQALVEHDLSLPEHAPLLSLCATAAQRDREHDHRLAVTARSSTDLPQRLLRYLARETRPGLSVGRARPAERSPMPVFVFSGQGSQWVGMGRALLGREPVFRATLAACDQHIERLLGFSLLSELMA